jgi:hypothetical protein
MAFELLGWDNPYEQFPAPVIPVGNLDGQLMATYPEAGDDPVPEDAVYIHFTAEQLEALQGFDRVKERLFATDANTVSRYNAKGEAAYFAKLLADPSFCQTFPAMRPILQRVADGG